MQEETTLKNLLGRVSDIIKKYDEIATLTGERFNVFQILGLSTHEVKTHSAFIAELLNPNGSHGKGDVFLKLFIECLKIEFDTKQAKVEVEKHTDKGNLDIIISNNEAVIIIENKIYAPDQKDQLLRYKNYAEQRYNEKWILYYLTLDGKESEESKGKLEPNKDYFPISYKEDIIKWLGCCLKEATNFPLLRETLNQYIYLIKHLTNQTMNDKMKQELIARVLENSNNIDAAIQIGENMDAIKHAIMQSFLKQIEESKYKVDFLNKEVFGKNETAAIFKKNSKYDVQIYFEGYNDVFIGIADKKDKWVENHFRRCAEWEDSSWADVYNGKVFESIKPIIDNYFSEIENMK